jgi:hypothetical protein
MKSIAQKSTPVRSIEVLVGGKMKNLIEFYLENVTNVLQDTTQLLQNFDDAQSQGVEASYGRNLRKFLNALLPHLILSSMKPTSRI